MHTNGQFRMQLIVPRQNREEVLRVCHDESGHWGFDRTAALIRAEYYWPRWTVDLNVYLQGCVECASHSRVESQQMTKMTQYTVMEPMFQMSMDILGPIANSSMGYNCILVVMDHFSKWVEAIPLYDQRAATIAEALVQVVFSRFATPSKLHSDQGRNFTSNIISKMCCVLGIKKTRTTPYHPESDGLVERFNRTLAAGIRQLCGLHETGSVDYMFCL